MTIHHVIALGMAVVLVAICVVFSQHCGAHMKDILYFAGTIATATFAHAQGLAQATKKKHKDLPKGTP